MEHRHVLSAVLRGQQVKWTPPPSVTKALKVVATIQSHQSEGWRDTYFLSHLVRNVLKGCDWSWA